MRLAQERVQHGHGGVQVRDDPVAERVDHLDVTRFLAGERVRGAAHGDRLAGRPVDGDGGGLLDHEPPAADGDQRVHRAKIDCHARPQPHYTCQTSNPPIAGNFTCRSRSDGPENA